MPPGGLCRHHAQVGAVTAAAFVLCERLLWHSHRHLHRHRAAVKEDEDDLSDVARKAEVSTDSAQKQLMELMRHNPVKFKLDVSDASVVDRPSYLARPIIINLAGKRVESTSCQQRKGDIIYLLVDPKEKKEGDSR